MPILIKSDDIRNEKGPRLNVMARYGWHWSQWVNYIFIKFHFQVVMGCYFEDYPSWSVLICSPENYVKQNLMFIIVTWECSCKGYNPCSLCFLVAKEEDEDMMDFSRHYTGIVIGVACAAIFAILSIITFSHTRRRLQERRNGSLTNSNRRPVSFSENDIFQQNAPPTYDDGKLLFLWVKVLELHNDYNVEITHLHVPCTLFFCKKLFIRTLRLRLTKMLRLRMFLFC